MKLRPPATPLITVDPYFSVWSVSDELNYSHTLHWTGTPHSIRGAVILDGVAYNFLGYERDSKKIKQTSRDVDALSTYYTFENDLVKLSVRFTSPLLPDDLYTLSRPVSYMSVSVERVDGSVKDISIRVGAEKWICLDRHHQSPVTFEETDIEGVCGFRIGNSVQEPLNKSGDDTRIDWGYFYLCAAGEGSADEYLMHSGGECPSLTVRAEEGEEKLFLFAYDDIYSINYFGTPLRAYWHLSGKSIEEAIGEAAREYESVRDRCDSFADSLSREARALGGEGYAELVSLAYRQVLAAHKLVADKDGQPVLVSKECFSNGCAATVDVMYPSSPLFIKYSPELLKAMLRPIYEYVGSGKWPYDFAPHDVGQYPLLLGQVYGYDSERGCFKYEDQMPVEESGNMIITEANIALASGNAEFAREHLDVLKGWAEYLMRYGNDPEDQLCTDDFAGHLAHNCNLSLKAIMGVMGMSIICDMLGEKGEAEDYASAARDMARSWAERAVNADGSYRLAFDLEGSRSMKYNMIWDKLWGTELFPSEIYESETAHSLANMNEYGLPLDSRCDQTKSDWLVWTASLASREEDFERMIAPLWDFYDRTPDRIPMSDWYDTVSGYHIGFRNRTVQGGLFIRLLDGETLKYRR